jgi:tRNA pseudouridine13 synthase
MIRNYRYTPSVRLLTSHLPGTGGLFKTVPEDFLVEEIPAYLPTGEGEHTFLFVEKRGLTTDEAVQQICRALSVPRDDAGTAGMKDRQALTRQWISLPRVEPEAALALSLNGIRILEARRHNNKLRTGHLRGNRFRIELRGVVDGAEARATAVLGALSQSGLPNRFGAQRFGARGDNAVRGRELVLSGGRSPRGIGRGERRLLVSAFQSMLFNRYLERRLEENLLRTPLPGDVMRKRASGGLFLVEEAELGQACARLESGELDVTGPMFGPEMRQPGPGTPAALREATLLAEEGLELSSFAQLGKLGEGTRRPLTVPIEEATVRPGQASDGIVLEFTLPPGAYATVLLDEVMKPSSGSESRVTLV